MSLSVFLYIFTEIYISAMFSVNLNIIEYIIKIRIRMNTTYS